MYKAIYGKNLEKPITHRFLKKNSNKIISLKPVQLIIFRCKKRGKGFVWCLKRTYNNTKCWIGYSIHSQYL